MPFKSKRGVTFGNQNKGDLSMSAVLQLEQAVSQLSPKELARFRKWFEEYDAKIWDKQFEKDAQSGKLDRLANRAIADFRAGKFKQL
jgi:hypothetical protein